jgi:hypothetical protein
MKKFVDTIQDPKEQTEIEAYIKDLGPADIGQFSLGFSHGRQWEHDKILQPKADPKEKEFHDFDVIAKMVGNCKGIKVAPDIVTAQGTKKGAKITMGVDQDTGQDIMRSMHLNDDKVRVLLLIIDMAEFEKVKSSMQL